MVVSIRGTFAYKSWSIRHLKRWFVINSSQWGNQFERTEINL